MSGLETELIEEIERLAGRPAGGRVRLGIGDDAAVVRPDSAREETLVTTDQVIENTHFIAKMHPSRALGHKLLARGLSDIAAMGGTPRHFLLSLALPSWAVGAWLRRFLAGLFHLGRVSATSLIGGDIARGDLFAAQVTVLGAAPKLTALLRSGAKPGNVLYVSGRPGGSVLGLERLRAGQTRGAAIRRHLYPEPRLALGRALREKIKATATIDLSDGLSTDLQRLTKASRVGAEVDAAKVPCFRGASAEQALHGGEEYELLFTVSPRTPVPAAFGGLPLTAIGRIRREPGVVLREAGETRKLTVAGFDHFAGA